MDPIEILISQGYTPDVAKKMVESGAFEAMNTSIPILPNLTGSTSQVGGNTSTSTFTC